MVVPTSMEVSIKPTKDFRFKFAAIFGGVALGIQAVLKVSGLNQYKWIRRVGAVYTTIFGGVGLVFFAQVGWTSVLFDRSRGTVTRRTRRLVLPFFEATTSRPLADIAGIVVRPTSMTINNQKVLEICVVFKSDSDTFVLSNTVDPFIAEQVRSEWEQKLNLLTS